MFSSTSLTFSGPLSIAKFGTNYAPMEHEITDIRRFLEGPLAGAAKLSAGMDEEEARLQELLKQKAALMEATKDHRALISPLRRLPDELLRRIFVSCLARDRNPTLSASEAPTLLTHVSSHWRRVALATQCLWAAIHIPIPSSFVTESLLYFGRQVDDLTLERRLKGVREWVARSGEYPLNFSLYEWSAPSVGVGFGDGEGSACGLVLGILLPASYRWRDVSFTADVSSLGRLRTLKSTDVPCLRSLELKLAFRRWGYSDAPWLGIKGGNDSILCAPSLTSFALAAPEGYAPHKWGAYTQLTSLTLESGVLDPDQRLSTSKARHILRQCLALEELTLQTGLSESTSRVGVVFDTERFQAVSLLRLKKLTLHEEEDQDSVLTTLIVPSLCSLGYSRRARGMELNEPCSVIQFMERHHPFLEIEAFTTNFQSLTVSDFMACLRLFPSLKVLRVKSSSKEPPSSIHFLSRETAHIKDEFLALISTGGLCPKLEDVELTQDGHFSEDAVFAFVRSKQQGRLSKLRRLAIVMGKRRHRRARDLKHELSGYVEAGLKLDVFYFSDSFRAPLSLFHGIPPDAVDS